MRAKLRAALKLIAAAAIAAPLFLIAPPAESATFALHGRALKGSERQPLPGLEVSLHIVHGNEELPGTTATSGSDGSFTFSSLTLDPQQSYFISAEYEGAYYTEGPIEPNGSEATQDLQVYEVGRDQSAVRVTNHHIIVERKPEELSVTEILVFENTGTTAYLGTGLNHAENVGVRLGLPASVKGFQAGMGGDDQSVRVQGRDLASLRPIPPGTRPFSFTYRVPMSGRMDLSHRLYFPTDKFVVLIQDPKLKLESSSLQYGGSRDQGGRKFEIYQGANFPVGAEVTIRVNGAGFWSNPKIYPWLLAPFLIIGALFFAAARGRRALRVGAGPGGAARDERNTPFAAPPGPASTSTTPTPPTEDEFANVYLFLIEALDRGVERGEFSKETHALIRGNLKRRLESILADQPRTGTR